MTHSENMRWTALLTAAALAVAAVWLAGASPGRAAGNSVRIEPPEAIVTSGGTSNVGLVAQPPAVVPSPDPNEADAGSLALWSIKIAFDPAVVAVAQGPDQNDLCTPMSSPPGADFASVCQAIDASGGDGIDDTVVSLGAVVFNDTNLGLTAESTLATITFRAVAAVATCSDLTVTVDVFDDLREDSDPTPSDPTVSNGRICVQGVARPFGDIDCGGAVNIGDAQKVARRLVALSIAQTEPCPDVAQIVSIDGTSRPFGDVDCGGTVKIGDSQKVARKLVGLTVGQTEPCPDIGQNVQVIG